MSATSHVTLPVPGTRDKVRRVPVVGRVGRDVATCAPIAGRLVPYWPGREARCTAGRCPALPQARPTDERTANIVAGRLVTYWPGREARCTAGRCPALPQARPTDERTANIVAGRPATIGGPPPGPAPPAPRGGLAGDGQAGAGQLNVYVLGVDARQRHPECPAVVARGDLGGRSAPPRPAGLPARRPGRDRTRRPSAGASGSLTSARSPRRAATFARVPRSPRR